MAIKKCKECGKDVSSKTKKCPHCGAPPLWRVSSGRGYWSIVLCTVVGLVIYLKADYDNMKVRPVNAGQGYIPSAEYQGNSLTGAFMHGFNEGLRNDAPSGPGVDSYNAAMATLGGGQVVGAQWSYTQRADPMGKGTTYFAQVLSSNTVSFDSPYGGPQHGTLMLRTHPRYGKDVILAIERGQFLCRSYEDCSILVRFDDQKASTYSAVGAADNSTESIFLRSYPRFIASMLKAKRVRTSAEIYQEGSPIFEFDVTAFDEAKYKPKQ